LRTADGRRDLTLQLMRGHKQTVVPREVVIDAVEEREAAVPTIENEQQDIFGKRVGAQYQTIR
jgi:hypothetical protein